MINIYYRGHKRAIDLEMSGKNLDRVAIFHREEEQNQCIERHRGEEVSHKVPSSSSSPSIFSTWLSCSSHFTLLSAPFKQHKMTKGWYISHRNSHCQHLYACLCAFVLRETIWVVANKKDFYPNLILFHLDFARNWCKLRCIYWCLWPFWLQMVKYCVARQLASGLRQFCGYEILLWRVSEQPSATQHHSFKPRQKEREGGAGEDEVSI